MRVPGLLPLLNFYGTLYTTINLTCFYHMLVCQSAFTSKASGNLLIIGY